MVRYGAKKRLYGILEAKRGKSVTEDRKISSELLLMGQVRWVLKVPVDSSGVITELDEEQVWCSGGAKSQQS